MHENQPWLRRASSLAVFVATAAIVVICDQIGRLLLPLLLPNAASALTTAVDAVVIALVAVFVARRFVVEPLAAGRREAAALLAAVPDPVVIVDGNGRVVAANPAVAETFGAGADLVGRPLFAALPPEVARSLLQQAFTAQRTGRPLTFDEEGTSRYWRFSLMSLGLDKTIIHVGDHTTTERLKAAAALAVEIDQRIPAPKDVPAVLRKGCAGLRRLFDAAFVWVAGKEENGGVGILACEGREADCATELKRGDCRWDDAGGRNPVGVAIRTGKLQMLRVSEAGVQEWQKAARRLGARMVVAVPLMRGEDVLGALALGMSYDVADMDVTAIQLVAGRVAAVLATAAEQQRFEMMAAGLETAANAVFITDRNGAIEWANAAFSRMSGLQRHEVYGRTPRVLKSGVQDAAVYQDLWQTILAGNVWNGEMVDRRKDGSTYRVRQTITPLRDLRGDVSHFVAVHEDVTTLRECEERMRHMAQHDALTDLPNRALFFDRLGQGMSVARRNRYSLGILSLNLDHFRLVNDSFGLRVGDLLLQMVASRLRQSVRESDTVARLGGDEFVIMLPQVLVREDAARVAQKVLEGMKPPFEIEGQEIHMGLSIGIALYPQDGETAEMLLARADAAVAAVKMQNRNGYKFAPIS